MNTTIKINSIAERLLTAQQFINDFFKEDIESGYFPRQQIEAKVPERDNPIRQAIIETYYQFAAAFEYPEMPFFSRLAESNPTDSGYLPETRADLVTAFNVIASKIALPAEHQQTVDANENLAATVAAFQEAGTAYLGQPIFGGRERQLRSRLRQATQALADYSWNG